MIIKICKKEREKMYDEMYVTEVLLKDKQREMEFITAQPKSSKTKQIFCRLPVIKKLDPCQCQG
jgi:phosphoribulokinase